MSVKQEKDTLPLLNEKIRFEKLQLIDNFGFNHGIIAREEALRIARETELDLVLIAEKGGLDVPVAKIIDFGKMLYAKKKQQAEAKKKQQVIQVKEIKLRPTIAEHDYLTKMKQGAKFLKEGKRLKITLMFKGRELAMKEERGSDLFNKIQETLSSIDLDKKTLVQENDTKAGQLWSRIYYLKNK